MAVKLFAVLNGLLNPQRYGLLPLPWSIPPWFWPYLPQGWFYDRLLLPEVRR